MSTVAGDYYPNWVTEAWRDIEKPYPEYKFYLPTDILGSNSLSGSGIRLQFKDTIVGSALWYYGILDYTLDFTRLSGRDVNEVLAIILDAAPLIPFDKMDEFTAQIFYILFDDSLVRATPSGADKVFIIEIMQAVKDSMAEATAQYNPWNALTYPSINPAITQGSKLSENNLLPISQYEYMDILVKLYNSMVGAYNDSASAGLPPSKFWPVPKLTNLPYEQTSSNLIESLDVPPFGLGLIRATELSVYVTLLYYALYSLPDNYFEEVKFSAFIDKLKNTISRIDDTANDARIRLNTREDGEVITQLIRFDWTPKFIKAAPPAPDPTPDPTPVPVPVPKRAYTYDTFKSDLARAKLDLSIIRYNIEKGRPFP